jgi:hypothetical protein
MIPLTGKAALERAIALGHVPSVDRQAPDRIYLSCSCGLKWNRRHSQKAVNAAWSFHVGKVLGEAMTGDRLNGGRPPFFSPATPEAPDPERGTAARTQPA